MLEDICFSAENDSTDVSNLLGEDFSASWTSEALPTSTSDSNASSELVGLSWPTNSDSLAGEFMPSKLLQEGDLNFLELNLSTHTDNKNFAKEKLKDTVGKANEEHVNRGSSSMSQVSWLSLFAELDPLANQNDGTLSTAVDRA